MRKPNTSTALAWVAVLSFAAVAVWPRTSLTVRNHLLPLKFPGSMQYMRQAELAEFQEPPPPPAEVLRVAAEHPHDLQLQLAAATSAEQLLQVVQRFPESPAAAAAYLLRANRTVRLTKEMEPQSSESKRGSPPGALAGSSGPPGSPLRQVPPGTSDSPPTKGVTTAAPTFPAMSPPGETAAVSPPAADTDEGTPPPGGSVSPAEERELEAQIARVLNGDGPPPTAAEVIEFLKWAEVGTRRDPSNAFFLAMKTIGLLACHKTPQALDAFLKIRHSAVWETYQSERQLGKLRLVEEAFNDHSANPAAWAQSSSEPVLGAQLRRLAIILSARAMLLERRGQTEDERRLRAALIRLGTLMTLSHSLMDSLDGRSICGLGTQMPTRTRAARAPGRRTREREYEDYLRQSGHPAEAQRVAAELAIDQRAYDILLRTIEQRKTSDRTFDSIEREAVFELACIAVLLNAAYMLLAGIIAALLLRREGRITLGRFLLLPTVLAAALALMSWLLARGSSLWSLPPEAAPGALIAFALVAIGFAIHSLVRRVPVLTGTTRGVAAAAVPMASLLVITYAVLVVLLASVDRSLVNSAVSEIKNETAAQANTIHQSWPVGLPD